MDASDNPAATRLALDGNLTIYEAPVAKNRLLNALSTRPILELDLSQIGEIDTAGLQLLVMIKREAARQDKSLQLVAHSAAVREVLDFFGMVGFFGDPLLIPAGQPA